MKRGFTLVEMLVVVGIIALLTGAMIGAYSKMTASAEKARCRELVQNTATALTAIFQERGVWPEILRKAATGKDAELDEKIGYALARQGHMSLSKDSGKKELAGYDRFGIVTPWAMTVIKARGKGVSLTTKIPGSQGTIRDHRLHFALDLDGDGIVEANVGGESVKLRATAAVWCCGKDGKQEAYTVGLKKDDVYSWSHGHTQNIE